MQAPKQNLEQAMISFVKLYLTQGQNVTMEDFANGNIFSRVLMHAEGFRFLFGEFQDSPRNWIQKLSNNKLIVKKISQYFESKLDKAIKVNDINIIEIAKNSKKSQIIKLFQLVIATMTEAPNKEEHINKIMSLDSNFQQTFVWLIQKILSTRIIQVKVYEKDRQLFALQELQIQNTLLQAEINSLLQRKQFLQDELASVKKKLSNHQNQFEIAIEKIDEHLNDKETFTLKVHNEQLKSIVDSLKTKIVEESRTHEIQIFKLSQEIKILNARIYKLEYAEQTLEIYKQKYNQCSQLLNSSKNWEIQEKRLHRLIAEKQSIIKRMEQKIDEAINENYHLQQKEIYLAMEFEKKEVQFKEMEKQVRKKMSDLQKDQTNSTNILRSEANHNTLSSIQQNSQLTSEDILENRQLKEALESLKKKHKQAERESGRLRKKVQKLSQLQKQKKKLQKMVVDAHMARTQQLNLLTQTISQIHTQNISYYKLLKQNKLLESK